MAVHHIHLFYEYLRHEYDSELISPLHQLTIIPKGTVSIFSVYTPNGVRLEFYEALT